MDVAWTEPGDTNLNVLSWWGAVVNDDTNKNTRTHAQNKGYFTPEENAVLDKRKPHDVRKHCAMGRTTEVMMEDLPSGFALRATITPLGSARGLNGKAERVCAWV